MTAQQRQLEQHQARIVDLERQAALLQRIVNEQSAVLRAMQEALAVRERVVVKRGR